MADRFNFTPFDFDETVGREEYVLIDKHLRLYISSALAKKLDRADGMPFTMHAAYENGRLALQFPQEGVFTATRPARFDNRRYASARPFIQKKNVPLGKYVYTEKGNGWFVFRLIDDVAPKQERKSDAS